MHYVKQFKINGVDTKQVACIELQGKPNAATEGAVGLLGIDMTSPTHDVYKCVAANGSIYTWELLSAGMSIICAKLSQSGSQTVYFNYPSLLTPPNYIVKAGDIILDKGGYLYQVSASYTNHCSATFCGINLGGTGNDSTYTLGIEDGKLQLLTLNGDVVSEIDLMLPDNDTITRNESTGEVSVRGVRTINDSTLRFFMGTKDEFDALQNNEGIFPMSADGNSALHSLSSTCVKARPIVGTIDEGAKSVTVELEENCVYVVGYGTYQVVLRVTTGLNVVQHIIPSFTGRTVSGVTEGYIQYDFQNKKFTRYDSSFKSITFSESPKFLKIAEFDI